MTKHEYESDYWVGRDVIVQYPGDDNFNNMPAVAMKRYEVIPGCIYVRVAEPLADRAFHYTYIHLIDDGPLPLPG